MKDPESTENKPSILQLFVSFLRLGLTGFGGPSTATYIRRLVVEKKAWLTEGAFNDGIALSQMIPGATSMQMAAYVGLKVRGLVGAATSFIGFGLPAFLMMMVFALLYARNHALPVVASAFSGLQAVIVAIIANAAISFLKSTLRGWVTILIAVLAAVLFILNVNPVLVILLAAGLGLALLKPGKTGSRGPLAPVHTAAYIRSLVLLLSAAALGALLLFLFKRSLFDLFILMFRIDLMAFGGGFASVPLMLHAVVDVRHWMDSQTFMNGIVLGQVTPGPVVITATFIGTLLGGLPGGLVATAGVFLPSFTMVVAVSPWFDRLQSSPAFNKMVGGVLCSFVGLLVAVTVRLAMNVHWDLSHLLLAAGALVALILKVDILWVVLAGTLISVIVFL
jgi:chromate transporter